MTVDPTEPMSSADLANLDIEAAGLPNVVLLAARLGRGGCVRADGSVDLGVLRRDVAARLTTDRGRDLRRLAQRIDATARPPRWRACPPDLAWHVRLGPAAADPRGLADLCARLAAEPLPLDRPPWELLVVPGTAGAAPGLVLRLHHAAADGVGGMSLVEALFGDAPREVTGDRPSAPAPATTPAGRARVRRAVRAVRRSAAVLGHAVPPTPLLGPLGPVHGVAFAEVDLHGLAERARRIGATVNDALLAVVAGAAGDALHHLGAPVPRTLPVSVPVALPHRAGSGNAAGVMIVRVPTGERDVRARTRQVARLTARAKEPARAQGTFEPTRHRWSMRLFARLARHQHLVAVFVSNVRGPAHRLHVAGAPVTGLWPVAPLQGNVRLGVTALSYDGVLSCSLHVDAQALPLDVLREAVDAGLHRVAGQRHPVRGPATGRMARGAVRSPA